MEVEQGEAQAHYRKPMKPWFVSIRRVISYMLREQRLLFVLVGIAIATLAFTTSNQPIPGYGTRSSIQSKSRIEYMTGGGMGSVGGKIPLGLKRKGLRVGPVSWGHTWWTD
ncbi:hypothetical protein F2Q69_00002369 [Brassica cretica]|uniref:Uncharacterized protein n=1 Tax=Brassica cretica TaxID=69181 RepID=A0A8S9P9R0_BRACR|nr:hypothetical protein F2Q69_00002369 [Brassica cretica]